jgi:hypothetical protein
MGPVIIARQPTNTCAQPLAMALNPSQTKTRVLDGIKLLLDFAAVLALAKILNSGAPYRQ